MKTLTFELSAQAAFKYEELEKKHGEGVKKLLEKVFLRTLERIERSNESDLEAIEEKLTLLEEDEREFLELASYIVEKNAELYRRLA
jgi:hypothetical protein